MSSRHGTFEYPAFTSDDLAALDNLRSLIGNAKRVEKTVLATTASFPLALSILRREPARGHTPEMLWLSSDAGNPGLEPILILNRDRRVGDCVIGDKPYKYSMVDLFVMKIEVVRVS